MNPSQKNGTREKSDAELVFLALKNANTYGIIIERYERKLANYIRRIALLPKEDVEDILQNVFIKTYQNLNGFNPSLKFSSWIYRITHNETISHLRKARARPNRLEFEDDEFVEHIASEENLENDFIKKENKEKVRQALAKLDEKYREILVLRFIEEKDYREISDILQKPTGTVSVMLKRGKDKLRDIIEKEKI